jgi:hypothetical protein
MPPPRCVRCWCLCASAASGRGCGALPPAPAPCATAPGPAGRAPPGAGGHTAWGVPTQPSASSSALPPLLAGGGWSTARRCLGPPFRSRSRLGPSPPRSQVPLRGGHHVVDSHRDAAAVRVRGQEPAPDDGACQCCLQAAPMGCCMCRLSHCNAPLQEFLIYVTASVFTLMALASSVAMCTSQPVQRGVSVCTGAGAAKMACVRAPHPPGDENELTDPTFPIPQHPPSGLRPSCGPPSC